MNDNSDIDNPVTESVAETSPPTTSISSGKHRGKNGESASSGHDSKKETASDLSNGATAESKCIFDGLSDSALYQLVLDRGIQTCSCVEENSGNVFAVSPRSGDSVNPLSFVFAAKANHMVATLPVLRQKEERALRAQFSLIGDEDRQAIFDEWEELQSSATSPPTQMPEEMEARLEEIREHNSGLFVSAWKALEQEWNDRYEEEIESLLSKYAKLDPVWWKQTLRDSPIFISPNPYARVDGNFLAQWYESFVKHGLITKK